VFAATVAGIVVVASPDWLPYFCSSDGDATGCESVSPLLVGFIGIALSLGLLLVGCMRNEP
jgi:hypothetical protein